MSKLNDHPLSLDDGALVIDKDLFDVTGIKKFFKVVINTDEDDFLSYPHSTSVRLLDKDDNIVYYELDHLELVTDEQIELEKKEVTDHKLSETEVASAMVTIERLIKHCVMKFQEHDIRNKLSLVIKAECFGGDRGITVEHIATVDYDHSVISKDLEDSLDIAIERYEENENLKPKEIMFDGTINN